MKVIATAMVLIGTGLSAYCLTWLGRSFSIDAQARRLVTGGPYAIVRHPLYLCEALALVGVAISNLSVWSVAIVSVNLALQYWRIVNEERVLGDAFEEYAAYSPCGAANSAPVSVTSSRIGREVADALISFKNFSFAFCLI